MNYVNLMGFVESQPIRRLPTRPRGTTLNSYAARLEVLRADRTTHFRKPLGPKIVTDSDGIGSASSHDRADKIDGISYTGSSASPSVRVIFHAVASLPKNLISMLPFFSYSFLLNRFFSYRETYTNITQEYGISSIIT